MARGLGMSRSVFRNASGLPDPQQVTTARDMATLARHLVRDFPAEYRWFSTPMFVWHGRTIANLRDRDGQLRTGAILQALHHPAPILQRSRARYLQDNPSHADEH